MNDIKCPECGKTINNLHDHLLFYHQDLSVQILDFLLGKPKAAFRNKIKDFLTFLFGLIFFAAVFYFACFVGWT